MLKHIPVHPILAALFPAFAIWSVNTNYIDVGNVLPVVFSVAIAATIVTLGFVTGYWNRHAGGLMALVVIVMFFLYGVVLYAYCNAMEQIAPSLARARYVFLTMVVLVGVLGIVVWRRRMTFDRWTYVLNQLAALFLAIPIVVVVYNVSISAIVTKGNVKSFNDATQKIIARAKMPVGKPPNVFYIILDEYARNDQLKRVFGFDNGEFLEQLDARGFYVAENSTSNYCRTIHSLASTFHMSYLDPLTEVYGERSTRIWPLSQTLVNNPVWDTFERWGYTTAAFQTGYHWAEFERADKYYRYKQRRDSEYSRCLLSYTPVPSFVELLYDSEENFEGMHPSKRRVLQPMKIMPKLAKQGEPVFVYAHIICPHTPFIFSKHGKNPAGDLDFSVEREERYRTLNIPDPLYLAGYTAQIDYLNDRILELIDAILDNSSEPPIIIIQADHGSGSRLHPTDLEQTDVVERFAILSAIYFPDGDYEKLYDTMTPVNTFRVVFDKFFDAKVETLPDRNYFSSFKTPYRYEEVTDRVHNITPQQATTH